MFVSLFSLVFFRLVPFGSAGFHGGVHQWFDGCLDDALLCVHVQHVECSSDTVELRATIQQCVERLCSDCLDNRVPSFSTVFASIHAEECLPQEKFGFVLLEAAGLGGPKPSPSGSMRATAEILPSTKTCTVQSRKLMTLLPSFSTGWCVVLFHRRTALLHIN